MTNPSDSTAGHPGTGHPCGRAAPIPHPSGSAYTTDCLSHSAPSPGSASRPGAPVSQARPLSGRRLKIHEIIFEADTPAGKAFDVALLAAILASVLVIMLESVVGLRNQYGPLLRGLEWTFTALFTVEYGLRVYSVSRPLRYVRSFFGLVDLLSILPTYVSFFFAGAQSLQVIRALRLLRIFRVLKLAHYLGEADILRQALNASRAKITVFLIAVLNIACIMGALMYLVEGEQSGFHNIPVSMYWAIVTMTTVGFGDIAPKTPLGQLLAAVLMLMGYGIIAVPTGIVGAEIARASRRGPVSAQACPVCGADGHDHDAVHCKYCGAAL
ncbi:MAG: ion transporter [Acidobacteria bacterium]|nr:ion transporter [Acidobacteriota bacterium]